MATKTSGKGKATEAKAAKVAKGKKARVQSPVPPAPTPAAPTPVATGAKFGTVTATVEAPGKKLSALEAAAKVLAEAGTPLGCQEMIDAMAAKGY